MRVTEPPSIASWILKHLTPGPSNEALAGDLFEEFRSGRSAVWYWRQVLAAISLGCLREFLELRVVTLFAVLWSMLVPAWLLIIASLEQHFKLGERIWRMDWPWSTVCDLGLLLAANLLFIWLGILLYLIPHLWMARRLNVRQIRGGILASIPGLIVLWVALIALPKYFLNGQVVDQPSVAPVTAYSFTHQAQIEIQRALPQEQWDLRYGEKTSDPYINPRKAIIDLRKSTLLVRLPFFLSLFCTLWSATSRLGNRRIGVAR